MNSISEVMGAYLYSLPQQFEHCLQMQFDFAARYRRGYDNILICGMGGSAIGGDILRTWGQIEASAPLIINRGYRIPHFINAGSLVIAISYSGNTEETLHAYNLARERGAQIICVASGGQLAALARENHDGLVIIPADLAPRAATGYLLAPVALILQELGILPGVRAAVEETVQVLLSLRRQLQPAAAEAANQARQIAACLKDSLTLIWGVTGSSEAAAMRWKGQINENAKALAFYNLFPELNHNEIVGFELPGEILARTVIIILRDKDDDERMQKRIKITKEIAAEKVKAVIEVDSAGQSFLARLYSLIYTGDYVSYYLALEYGIDPAPVKVIDFLKAELGR